MTAGRFRPAGWPLPKYKPLQTSAPRQTPPPVHSLFIVHTVPLLVPCTQRPGATEPGGLVPQPVAAVSKEKSDGRLPQQEQPWVVEVVLLVVVVVAALLVLVVVGVGVLVLVVVGVGVLVLVVVAAGWLGLV